MVIYNMIVGSDRMGKELRCGDICSFQIRNNLKNKQESRLLRGIVVYDPEWYAFAFATMDKTIPGILMSAVERNTIEYEVSIKGDGFIYRNGDGSTREATYCSDDESSQWHMLYRKNLE